MDVWEQCVFLLQQGKFGEALQLIEGVPSHQRSPKLQALFQGMTSYLSEDEIAWDNDAGPIAVNGSAKAIERYSLADRMALWGHLMRTYDATPKVYANGLPNSNWEVLVLEPTAERPYYILLTVGLGSCDCTGLGCIEFVLMLPENWQLNSQSLEQERWAWPLIMLDRLADTADLAYDTEHLLGFQQSFAADTELCALLLVKSEEYDDEIKICLLPNGKIVSFYQVIPLYQAEYDYALKFGTDSLIDLLIDVDLPTVIDPHRSCICSNLSTDEFNFTEPDLRFAEYKPAAERTLFSYSPRELAAIEHHIERNFGVTSFVDEGDLTGKLKLSIHVIEPTDNKPYYLLVSSGFGAYRMNCPGLLEGFVSDRAEFVMVLPPNWKMNDKHRAEERWSWPFFLMHALVAITLEQHEFMMMDKVVSFECNLASHIKFCGCMLLPAEFNPFLTSFEAGECQLFRGKKVSFYLLAPLYRDEIDFVLNYGPAQLLREIFKHGLVVDVHRPHLLHQASHHPNTNKIKRHPSKRGKKQGGHKGHARPKRY